MKKKNSDRKVKLESICNMEWIEISEIYVSIMGNCAMKHKKKNINDYD